jgi:hypothetical protein
MTEKKDYQRQPYKKPSIKVIELVADEVLAVGCKTSVVHSGKNPPIGTLSCTSTSNCFQFGS